MQSVGGGICQKGCSWYRKDWEVKYVVTKNEELDKLGIEFGRYKERWDKLSRSVKSVNQSLDELHTTTEKITKRFQSIKNAEIDKLKHDETLRIEDLSEEEL